MFYNLCIAGVGVALYIFLVWRMTTWYDQKKIHWIIRDVVVFSSATFFFGFAIHIFTVQDYFFSNLLYGILYGLSHIYYFHNKGPVVTKIKKKLHAFSDSLFPKNYGKKD